MMLAGMNHGHNKMALWCIDECIRPAGEEDILDIGCGGGQNIANFLRRTKGKVCGADYSAQSVAKSVTGNRKAVRDGRAEIIEASVSSLPYEPATFDLATAFETGHRRGFQGSKACAQAGRQICRLQRNGFRDRKRAMDFTLGYEDLYPGRNR